MMIESTAAEKAIRELIGQQGRITFADFMRTALYHPVDGYYSSDLPFGASGDYYTSPAVHPAFGALLAVQLFWMWRCIGSPTDFTVIELGAGNGLMSDEICTSAATLSEEFAESLTYICLDRYVPHGFSKRAGGSESLIQWIRTENLPLRSVVGCFISNEFVDAFPVHRFQMLDGELLEVYVGLGDDGEFTELLDVPSTPLIGERLNGIGLTPVEGQRGEVNLQIGPWLSGVADALQRGFVLTIDYGHLAPELYSPSRRSGTLQTYYRHTEGSSPFQRIGRQDMTAHVDFSSLQSEGIARGLNPIEYTTQGDFLRALGLACLMDKMSGRSMHQTERNANMTALRELAKPDGLGGFKVLVQEKGTGISHAAELVPPIEVRQTLHSPLLTDRHMPLMQGRYPHTSWEAPSLWGEWEPTSR